MNSIINIFPNQPRCFLFLAGDMDITVFSKYVSDMKRVYPAVEGRIKFRNSAVSTAHGLVVMLLGLCLSITLWLALFTLGNCDEVKDTFWLLDTSETFSITSPFKGNNETSRWPLQPQRNFNMQPIAWSLKSIIDQNEVWKWCGDLKYTVNLQETETWKNKCVFDINQYYQLKGACKSCFYYYISTCIRVFVSCRLQSWLI